LKFWLFLKYNYFEDTEDQRTTLFYIPFSMTLVGLSQLSMNPKGTCSTGSTFLLVTGEEEKVRNAGMNIGQFFIKTT
jgi:hypothetical protein